jgi:hypothetical protein
MKLKLFFRMYSTYLLISINLLLFLWSNPFYILTIILFYLLFIQEYNRVGFVNNRMKYYILIYVVSLILLNRFDYRTICSILLILFVIRFYSPYRSKIKLLLNQIDLNEALNIYTNRFEQSECLIKFGYEIRQSEIEWLSCIILYRSKKLKQSKLVYSDNEILGSNFSVNIT